MIGSRLDNFGKGALAVAAFVACGPFLILGRTSDPGTQAYQEAKGSWIPAVMMNHESQPFWLVAAGLGIIGGGLIGLDRFVDRRRGVRRRDRPTNSR